MDITNNTKFIIKSGINGLGVFAANNIRKGEMILPLSGSIVPTPTRTSIQLESNNHVENEIGALINHSCMANAMVDRQTKSLVSMRDIKVGEEITFNYNQNEDVLFSPFTCDCCGKRIEGKMRKTAKV